MDVFDIDAELQPLTLAVESAATDEAALISAAGVACCGNDEQLEVRDGQGVAEA